MRVDSGNLVHDHLTKVRSALEDAIDRVFELATTGDPMIQEVTRNLIWMDFYEGWEVFPEVKDKKGRPIGYNFSDAAESVLGRLWFIRHFVSHELLDDGDPGVGWAVSLDDRHLTARTAFATVPPKRQSTRRVPPARRCIVRSRDCLCEGENAGVYQAAYARPEVVLEVICEAIWHQAEYRSWARPFFAKDGMTERGAEFTDSTANSLREFARKHNIKPAWVQE